MTTQILTEVNFDEVVIGNEVVFIWCVLEAAMDLPVRVRPG